MRNHINANVVANRARMLRGNRTWQTVLLVEGPSDSRFFKKVTDPGRCLIVIAEGKANALGALDILKRSHFTGVLAIVDADFDRLRGRLRAEGDVVYTDGHDLEVMLLQSGAVAAILAEFDLPSPVEEEMLRFLFHVGRPIGALRFLSVTNGWYLNFSDLSYEEFVTTSDNGAVDLPKLSAIVRGQSSRLNVDSDDIQKRIDELCAGSFAAEDLCCGHDLASVLALFISRRSRHCHNGIIEQLLRVGSNFAWFCQTKLCAAIEEWEETHAPYRVLPTIITELAQAG